MECVIHGVQTGTISQAEAEERHTAHEQCPQCVANIAKHGNRRAP
jgi:ribosomal protein S27AE